MKRTTVVQIRLTAAEKAKLHGLAAAAGMSVSSWIRWKLLRKQG